MALLESVNLRSLDSGAIGPSAGAIAEPEARARRVAEEFEAVFVAEMVRHMMPSFTTLGVDDPGGLASSTFAQELARVIARSGGVGLSDAVYDQFLELQGAAA